MLEKLDQKSYNPNSGCCSPSETSSYTEGSIVRRDFLKFLGIATGGVFLGFPA
ncbi:MAG: twin-arginine translocation signal domain-containing protein, partial [Bacteroidia bacterium]